ncbi:KN motif and ankyrin repeat domains [Seminavis robusta]|uniref:KN motif and ankyrin repeat domains n=1 Tax=Seminavis robusta TaxID=568900 RepID=A0A9N8HSK7_9STRA|nr:KN motif and ankyrin repeat domains [Seminavis robusta]|eukprot:Sro1178_g249490.1 KN motif and ankyrin repeat domains (821) ;mRNA; f:12042-14608
MRVRKKNTVVPWPSLGTAAKTLDASTNPALEDAVGVGERGITCHQLQDLTRFIQRLCQTGLLRYQNDANPQQQSTRGSRILWTQLTMFDVCYEVIKPIIVHLDRGLCSWSSLVNQGRRQRPSVFISHSWSEKYRDFVATLEHLQLDRGMTPTDVVWICTFANNQFQLDLGARLSKSPFYDALEFAQDVALFLDYTASALSRSWCNFELAITTDTPYNRLRWKVRRVIAEKENVGLFDVAMDKVDAYLAALDHRKKHNSGGSTSDAGDTDDDTLRTFKSSQAESFSTVDRRRIMNHIAYKYLAATTNHRTVSADEVPSDEDRELEGLKMDSDGKLILADEQKHAYESNLTSGPLAEKFQKLDENVFLECNKALERRGLVTSTDEALAPKQQSPTAASSRLSRKSAANLRWEECGLTLSQLRQFEIFLEATCKRSKMKVEGGATIDWSNCSSRHLFPCDWKGLAKEFMPPDTSYVECISESGQAPEYYVILPYDMLLKDAFKAIEWHAEALRLSDRTTYFVFSLALLSGIRREGSNETVMEATTGGLILLMSEDISRQWVDGPSGQSLWSFYELWLADQCGLPWDVVCSTGAIATSRPFATSKWEVGSFSPVIAENLASVEVDASEARMRNQRSREKVLSKIGKPPGGVANFNERITACLSVRMLPPLMRHAAYLDEGLASLNKLNDALKLLEKHRSKSFVNLVTFQGAFGEGPLHVMAARSDLDKSCIASAHSTMLALVHAGFGVNDQDDNGETPLHWAASAGAEWTTAFLLRQGANPMIPSYRGEDPLQVAKAKPVAFLYEYSPKIVPLLRGAMQPWQTG